MGEYVKVESVEEAQRSLREETSATVVAGGQEVTLDLRQGSIDPRVLVDISDVDALNEIAHTADGLRVGSCVTYRDLERDKDIRAEYPTLVETIEGIAGPQVRNNGTLGGALCDADPVFDAPTVLLALDASVTLSADETARTVPLSEFYTSEGETVLADEELLTSILVPTPPARSAGAYRSMTPRQGDSTVAGVAVRLVRGDDTACRRARIALTNGAPMPRRVPSAEAALAGTTLDEEHIERAANAIRDALELPDDLRSASYRETVFGRLAGRAIRDARDGLPEVKP